MCPKSTEQLPTESQKPKKLKSHRPEREQHFWMKHLPENIEGYTYRQIIQIYLLATENDAILAFIKEHQLLKGHHHRRAIQHLYGLLDISKASKKKPNGTTEETQKQFRLRRVVHPATATTKFVLCLKGLDVSQHPQTFIEKDEIEIEVPAELLTPQWVALFWAIDAGEDVQPHYVRKTRLSREVVRPKHKKACATIDIDFFHGLDPDNPDFVFAFGEAEIHHFQKFFRDEIAEITGCFGGLANHISSGKLAKIARKLRRLKDASDQGKKPKKEDHLDKKELSIWHAICEWKNSEAGVMVREACRQVLDQP